LIESVAGCGGTLSGSTFATAPLTGTCSITCEFQARQGTRDLGEFELLLPGRAMLVRSP
jgi:hypothetical protein